MAFIRKNMPKLDKIRALDIGCGSGRDIKILESLGAKEVYGIDSSGFMIGVARKAVNKPNNLFIASIEKMPFKDNFFDVVHLTGHAGKNKEGNPIFMMENDTGQTSETTAKDIADICRQG